MITNLACFVAEKFATGWALVLFITLCVVSRLLGLSDVYLTFILSVLAISMSQLIMIAQDKDTKAIQAKLDGLVKASEAPDELAELEKRDG